MIYTHQGVCSSRNNWEEILNVQARVDDMNPSQEAYSMQEDEMFSFAVLAEQNEGTIYCDLTGRFPVQSYMGMHYIFVAYIYSKNALLLRAMLNRTDASMIKVFKEI